MKPRIIALLSALALFSASAAQAAPPAQTTDPAGASTAWERGCATPEPTSFQRAEVGARMRARQQQFGLDRARGTGGTIDVAFHVLHDGPVGDVTDQQIADQIQAMNDRYAGSGYRFRLTSVDRTDNKSWFTLYPGTGTEKQMKQALAVDPAHHLNIYTADLNKNLLGWAYFPFSFPEDSYWHGVVVHYGSLPGGFITRFNLGLTAVHETGHYLGLFHTFQGGCVPPGDEVDDTPFEASPAFGCPVGRNTCPQAGDDPIHNYMDYTDDACYTEFTSGQIERTREILPVYRPSLLRSDAPIALAAPASGAGPTLRGGVTEFLGARPNPFASSTLLRFTLASREHVSLAVYDIAGKRVASLLNEDREAGDQSVAFAPKGLAPGMYFTVLRAGGATISRTAILIR
jgi:hypothetical protein